MFLLVPEGHAYPTRGRTTCRILTAIETNTCQTEFVNIQAWLDFQVDEVSRSFPNSQLSSAQTNQILKQCFLTYLGCAGIANQHTGNLHKPANNANTMYIYIYLYLYLHMLIYIYMYIYLYLHCIYIHVYIYIYLHLHMYFYMVHHDIYIYI